MPNPLVDAWAVVESLLAADAHASADVFDALFPLPEAGYRTVIEAVTALNPNLAEPEAVDEALEKVVDSLGLLVRGVRMATKLRISSISRPRLPVLVLYLTRVGGDAAWRAPTLMNAGYRTSIPGSPAILDGEGLERLGIWLSNMQSASPFSAYAERYRRTIDECQNEGDYPAAVLSAQLAVEALLDSVLSATMWEDGMLPSVARIDFTNTLANRVKRCFHNRLRGDWSLRTGRPMGLWHSDIRLPRNRMVHSAYSPTKAEGQLAMVAMAAVDEFVRERVCAARRTFPRTALMLLGRPGLIRLGGWDREMQEFAEVTGAQEPRWVDGLNLWMAQLEASVSRALAQG